MCVVIIFEIQFTRLVYLHNNTLFAHCWHPLSYVVDCTYQELFYCDAPKVWNIWIPGFQLYKDKLSNSWIFWKSCSGLVLELRREWEWYCTYYYSPLFLWVRVGRWGGRTNLWGVTVLGLLVHGQVEFAIVLHALWCCLSRSDVNPFSQPFFEKIA